MALICTTERESSLHHLYPVSFFAGEKSVVSGLDMGAYAVDVLLVPSMVLSKDMEKLVREARLRRSPCDIRRESQTLLFDP